ncbi:MAG: hypothetical protein ACRDTG_03410 [Pseudonocardiaceae bacterium]
MGSYTSSLTCTVDGLAHLVSDDAAAAGIAAGRGTYIALCGHTVHAAAMVSAIGRACPRCALHVEAIPEPPRRGNSGRARLRRLFGYRMVEQAIR